MGTIPEAVSHFPAGLSFWAVNVSMNAEEFQAHH